MSLAVVTATSASCTTSAGSGLVARRAGSSPGSTECWPHPPAATLSTAPMPTPMKTLLFTQRFHVVNEVPGVLRLDLAIEGRHRAAAQAGHECGVDASARVAALHHAL